MELRFWKNLSVLILLSLSAAAAQNAYDWPTEYVAQYFEQGSMTTNVISPWFQAPGLSGSGTIGFETSVVHSGAGAVKFTTGGTAGIAYQITQTNSSISTNCFMRAYERFSGVTMASGDNFQCLMAAKRGVGGLIGVRFGYDGTDYHLYSSTGTKGSNPVTLDAWHCIELRTQVGSGTDGVLQIWLDGTLDVNLSNTSQTQTPDECRIGVVYKSAATVAATVYVDDLIVSPAAIGIWEPGVVILHPRFNSRIGSPLKILCAGVSVGDTLTTYLKGAEGTSNLVATGAAALCQTNRMYLTNLAADTYTLISELKNSGGTILATNGFRWVRPYATDPVFSIDAYNRFTSNGIPWFPVTSFGIEADQVGAWATNVNAGNGQGWDDQSLTHFVSTLNSNGMYHLPVMGPIQIDTDPGSSASDWSTNEYLYFAYITNTAVSGHTNLFAWNFIDEPETGKSNWWKPPHVYQLWNAVETNTPTRFVLCNFMSSSVLEAGWVQTTMFYYYPTPIADGYGVDIYPIDDAWGVANSGVGIDRLRFWQHDLFPTGGFVETGDVSGEGVSVTAAQVRCIFWENIVHGARWLSWYPYQPITTTPAANYAEMARCVGDVEALRGGVVGLDGPAISGTNSSVCLRCSTGGTTNYIFEVNTSAASKTNSVTVAGLANATLTKYGGGTVTASDGVFSDTFDAYGVNIYYWKNEAEPPAPVTLRANNARFYGTVGTRQ